jgi:hypothetical protein
MNQTMRSIKSCDLNSSILFLITAELWHDLSVEFFEFKSYYFKENTVVEEIY